MLSNRSFFSANITSLSVTITAGSESLQFGCKQIHKTFKKTSPMTSWAWPCAWGWKYHPGVSVHNAIAVIGVRKALLIGELDCHKT